MHDRYFAVHGSGGRVLPVAAVLVGFAFVLTGSPTLAGPPPWAPAHGYRAQGGPPPWAPAHGYRAKKGKSKVVHVYQLPPGLQGGRCNPSLFDGPTAGGLLGAAAGGYAGSQFGRGDGKLAATALGTLVGFVLGQQVGSQLTYAEESASAGPSSTPRTSKRSFGTMRGMVPAIRSRRPRPSRRLAARTAVSTRRRPSWAEKWRTPTEQRADSQTAAGS